MDFSAVDFIRMQRRSRFWSVRKLARAAVLSPAYVSQIENGNRPLTPRAAGRIADAFGIPPYELLALAGFIPQPDLDRAKEMAQRALNEAPEIAAKAGPHEVDGESGLDWLVIDYLYLLGHDPYGTGWDGGPGGHQADWRILDPSAPPPMMERLKPDIEAWQERRRELEKRPLSGWDALTLEEKQLIQELVDKILSRRTAGE